MGSRSSAPTATAYSAPCSWYPFMPAMANLAESIAYGDWSRYFVRIAEEVRFELSEEVRFQNESPAQSRRRARRLR